MLISEIYQSRQGEGLLVGTPSLFVRTSGCNLRCGFCDTPFASWDPSGQRLSVAAVVDRVRQLADQARHVVLTGGEPMLPREVVELTESLQSADFHITIETAGTIDREVGCDLMSISPKLANSDPAVDRAGPWLSRHRRGRHRPEIARALIERYPYQLKFVVDRPEDLEEIDRWLEELGDHDPARVLLMPQGIDQESLQRRESWLAPLAQSRGFRLCRRMHILWYGNRRGT